VISLPKSHRTAKKLPPKLARLQRLFAHPAFKRKKIPNLQGFLFELQKSLGPNRDFFERLPLVPKPHGVPSFRVRVYSRGGFSCVVKDTKGEQLHGYSPGLVRKAIKQHHRFLRAGKITATKYILRTPRVLGRKGNFLFLEAITHDSSINDAVVRNALGEMELNFFKMKQKRPLQTFDMIPAGIYHGKVVFYAPYDFDL